MAIVRFISKAISVKVDPVEVYTGTPGRTKDRGQGNRQPHRRRGLIGWGLRGRSRAIISGIFGVITIVIWTLDETGYGCIAQAATEGRVTFVQRKGLVDVSEPSRQFIGPAPLNDSLHICDDLLNPNAGHDPGSVGLASSSRSRTQMTFSTPDFDGFAQTVSSVGL